MKFVPSYTGIKKTILKHKILSALGLIVIVGGGYFMYHALTNSGTETRYVLGTAENGTIVSAVSVSGQVSASDQLDIKPKVSGEVTWVGMKAGDTVRVGQALATIDDTTAKQQYQSDLASVKTAELQYQQDEAQAPVTYQNDLNNLSLAKDDLSTAYANTFDQISSAYLDLAPAVPGMEDILYGTEMSATGSQKNSDVLLNYFSGDERTALQPFADTALSDYATAKADYDKTLADYQKLTRSSPTADIESVLSGAVTTDTEIAQTLQDELNFLGKVNELATAHNYQLRSAFTTLQSNAKSYLSTVNGDLSSLLSEKKTLDQDKQAIVNDQNAVTLVEIGNASGTNPISLQITAANLAKQKQDLQNEADNLADYTVVAPFDGVLSAVNVQKGDQAGSAAVATIITNDRIAELSLNEVDVAKIKIGDKATLTFDAIDGLSLTGTVAEIDTVGTVSQGVVSYDVKIDFSSQDERVKPGMTVNAEIQTGVAQNVLTVPTSAVKTVNGQSIVQVFTPALSVPAGASALQGVTSATPPQAVPVTTGLSDDTNIEITSGLTEGEQIVVRTTTGAASAASAATSRTTTGSASGATRSLGGGGAVFIGGKGG